MSTLALPEAIEHWSLTTPREKLVKIGAKVARHGRYVMAFLSACLAGLAMVHRSRGRHGRPEIAG